MNDEEFERQIERLKALRARWWKPLGLGWWDIEFKYIRTDFGVDGHPEPDTIATTNANWRYLHGTMRWNMPVVKATDDEELEQCFVHEAAHILLNEVTSTETAEDEGHGERVSTTVARAFLHLRDAILEERAGEPFNGHVQIAYTTSPPPIQWTAGTG